MSYERCGAERPEGTGLEREGLPQRRQLEASAARQGEVVGQERDEGPQAVWNELRKDRLLERLFSLMGAEGRTGGEQTDCSFFELSLTGWR